MLLKEIQTHEKISWEVRKMQITTIMNNKGKSNESMPNYVGFSLICQYVYIYLKINV